MTWRRATKRCARAAPGSRWGRLHAATVGRVMPATVIWASLWIFGFAPICEYLPPQHILLVKLYNFESLFSVSILQMPPYALGSGIG
jgi:hypothetical protein